MVNAIKVEIRQLKWEDLAMIFFFASRFFTAIFFSILGKKGIFLAILVLCVIYVLSIRQNFREKNYSAFFFFAIIALSIVVVSLITMILNPSTRSWIMSFNNGLLIKTFDPRKALFAAFVFLFVTRNRRILFNLNLAALLSFCYLLIQVIFYLSTGSWINYYMLRDETLVLMPYNMSLGYEMIFVSIVFLATALSEKKKVYAIIGIIAFCVSFYFGSRGIVLPIAVFLFLSFVFNSDKSDKKLLIKWSLIGLCIFIVFIFLAIKIPDLIIKENHVLIKNEQLDDIGLSDLKGGNRNISMLVSKSFTESNGRDKIWKISWDAIKEIFPLGYGVYGDRPFVGPRFRWGYSHNFILEMMISFGIAGLILICFFVYLTLKYLIKNEYTIYRPVLIILLSMNSKLLISDSFWHYSFFWALVAYMIMIESTTRIYKKTHQVGEMQSTNKLNFSFSKTYPLVIVTSILLILSIGLSIGFIKIEVDNMRYRTKVFKSPTVVVAIESTDMQKVQSLVNKYGLPVTTYNSSEPIEKELKSLMNTESIDIQLLVENELLSQDKSEVLINYITDSTLFLTTKNDDSFRIAKVDAASIHPRTIQLLESKVDATVLDKKPNGNYFYRYLRQSDYTQLYSLDSSINSKNVEKRMNYIINQIRLARSNNGLILIHFKNLGNSENYNRKEDYTEEKYFSEIISLLRNESFEFVTMDDLVKKAKYDKGEKNLINLIRNSDIYRALR